MEICRLEQGDEGRDDCVGDVAMGDCVEVAVYRIVVELVAQRLCEDWLAPNQGQLMFVEVAFVALGDLLDIFRSL